MDATSADVLSIFAFLEGPRCSWMPFSHDTGIETQKVSKNELFGLKASFVFVVVSSILGGILLQAWH